MNFARKVNLKNATVVFLVLVMLLSMLPQSAFADTQSYTGTQGNNPWITMTTSSSVSVSDIVTDDAVEEYFSNTINTELDPQSELRFRFVPSGSGTQDPDEASIIANTLPYISIYRAEDAITQTAPVAGYDNGTGKIRLEKIRTGQTQDTGTVDIEIAVAAGTLQNKSQYALVFDKELSVKNTQNKIGRDIVFYFKTKEAESGLSLDKTFISTTIGQEETLAATYNKEAVDSQLVTWSSSNEAVAEVEGGTVKAVSEGTALITAEYNEQQVTCSVTVGVIPYDMQGTGGNQFAMLQPDDITVLSINDQRYLNRINASFHDDEDIKFIFTMSAGMQQLTDEGFLSSNIGYINVYDSYGGNIVARYAPTGNEKKLIYDGYEAGVGIKVSIPKVQLERGTYYLVIDKRLAGNASDKILGKDVVFQFKITDPNESIEAESISLDWHEVTLAAGAVLNLKTSILPADTTDKTVTWESSEEDVASVDQEGNVTAVSAGTAVITAKTANGKDASCSITVEESNIKLNTSVLEMSLNEVQTLKAYMNGEKISPEWESSSPETVSVDDNGNLRALSSGHAVITASSGSEHTGCVITVTSSGVYTWQGVGGNSMKMQSYDDIYVKNIDSTAFYNGINTLVDGSQDILFGFTMSAGINNFTAANFNTNCMPYIKVFDTYPDSDMLENLKETDGCADISYLKFETSTIYLQIPAKALKNGTYYLVFGAKVCGNNVNKTLGKPVIFKFTVNWDISDLTVTLTGGNSSLEKAISDEMTEDQTMSEIETLHIITDGEYELTAADYRFIRENLGQTLTELDLKSAALTDNKLAEGALEGCSSLQKITLPANITVLGAESLYGCSALTTIVMTGEVPPVIEDSSALEGTALSEIIVPSEYQENYNESSLWQNYEVIVKAEEITISPSSLTIEAGGTKAITADILPANASNKTVVWSTSDASVAKVDQQGNITGIQDGTAVITAAAEDGGFEASCKVTVTPKISLNTDSIKIYSTGDGRTYQLTAEVTGSSKYTADDIEWESYDETVAKVSSSGLVTGIQGGQTVVFARLNNCFKFCLVKVNEHTVSLNKETAGLLTTGTGNTTTLKATVDGAVASGPQVIWSSSDTSVASVTRYTGIITGKKAGTAVITAEAQGKQAVCTVTVSALGSPTVKTASAAYNKVKVTWSGVGGASGYIVSRCTKSGTVQKSWTMSSSARSMTETGRTAGTTYYYKVCAYKTVNGSKLCASYSTIKSVKPVPAKVNGVKTAKKGTCKIKVSWKKVSGASGYVVYRSTKKTSGFKAVKTVKRGSTVSYTTGKLTKNKTYYFKVRAYRTVSGKKVYGDYSSVVSRKAK